MTNRTVAGIVVAVMLGMAAVGLTFALQTVGVRRANDNKGALAPEPAPEVGAFEPAKWPGLGYLPDDVQAVAGIRVAEALDSPAGRALVARFGLADTKKSNILGVAPGNVEYLMFGASLRALPPRVIAVVHGSINDAPVSAARATEHHGKTLHRLKLWPTGPEGPTWRADRHTLIATQLPDDFDHIPVKPRTTVPLSELLTERLDLAAIGWLATKPDMSSPAFALVTPSLPPAEHDAWVKLDALTVSIRADGTMLTATVQLRGKDAAAGNAIANSLVESLTKTGIAAERKLDGDWQKLTATAEAETLASGVKQLLGKPN